MKINNWFILILVIGIFTFSGCNVDVVGKVRDNTLETFETGFKKGVNCTEIALEQGHPVEYCYKVLDILINTIKAEDGKN